MSDLEARIAEMLGAHIPTQSMGTSTGGAGGGSNFRTCACGHRVTVEYSELSPLEHDTMPPLNRKLAAHQASMLAPVIREREAEAWDRARTEIRGIPCWYESETKNGFDLWTDAAGNATEHGARIAVMKILNTNPYKESSDV